MKTYTLEELEKNRKTGMDYAEDHRKMIEALKEERPQSEEDSKGLWPLPRGADSFWTTENIMNPDGTKQEGCGRVPKGAVDQ